MSYRKVLVADSLNGTTYYDVEKSGGFEQVCLALFLERDKAGAYQKEKPRLPKRPPDLPENVDEWVGKHWDTMLAEYEERRSNYRHMTIEWSVLVRARNGDANAASWIIRARKEEPGEKMEMFRLKEARPGKKPKNIKD